MVAKPPDSVTNLCENCGFGWTFYDTGEVRVGDTQISLDEKVAEGCLLVGYSELLVNCLRCGDRDAYLIQFGDSEDVDITWHCDKCGFEWKVSGDGMEMTFGWIDEHAQVASFKAPRGTLLVASEEL
jgi:DNA-directed RNA polymerase subunit M/transcription elongation factor TFIIS